MSLPILSLFLFHRVQFLVGLVEKIFRNEGIVHDDEPPLLLVVLESSVLARFLSLIPIHPSRQNFVVYV
ncbi:hypothetical protein FRACYDRAFT_267284 [Fragilariopsis cylindrus CCMP1102]|uniref:Secreted protein n=1 Tax=Fragilariopsis cylindrus CCMP1102 TaxID=635003 RepID=A0A1E7FWB4_9STRA|nr:hypothetical protein FRACYDRAFT_267284 [Fragilariopsis cylindrus CCMP1102]|eukprot:OEU22449.1 hypothetical protein FRACYDRAFT_267284 [Fragilariopsis cylindrus CCMP1102]